MDSWLQGSAKLKCTPRTIDGYESIKRVHLSPALGSLLLRELTPSKIQALYAKATEKWSSRSVYYWHRVLSEACKFGVRQGLLVSNPCLLCDPPKVVRKIMRALNPAEAEIIMVAAKDSPFYPVYFTASIPACGKVNY